MVDLQALRADYRAQKTQLLQSIASPQATARDVRKLLTCLSHLADGLLRQLWAHAGLQEPFALLAVGGFGRGELFPQSDVDVLLLLPDAFSIDADAMLRERIERFIGSCWDAGLEIGSSVRTLSDCLAEAPDHRQCGAGRTISAGFFCQHRCTRFFYCKNAGDAPAPHQV